MTNTFKTSLISSTATGLLLAMGLSIPITMVGTSSAWASECLVDTNDDGNADSNVDTVNGSSSSNGESFACGRFANATTDSESDGATAFGSFANANGRGSTSIGNDVVASGDGTLAVGGDANTIALSLIHI